MDRQYVVIDLHRERSLIVREDAHGEELAVTRIDNDPLTLARAVGEAGPSPMVAVEATYGWYWAVDVLTELGADVQLVHPSELNWDSQRVKNDYRDCRELLDRLRLGKLPEAWIAPPAVRDLRGLVRYRCKLVRLRTGLKAQVKAVLAKAGLHPPVDDLWGIAGGKYLDGLQLADGSPCGWSRSATWLSFSIGRSTCWRGARTTSSRTIAGIAPSRFSTGSARCWRRCSSLRSAT